MRQKLNQDIGMKLRKFRKGLRLTQAEMVSHFDIGRANYSRIEKGEVFPNVTILHTLKTKFNISLNWLIAAEGETSDDQMMLDQKQQMSFLSFNEDRKEIEELLHHMGKIPMIRHAVLGFFMEYRMRNSAVIQKLSAELEAKEKETTANVENEECEQPENIC
ncbi:MAG: Helix-turn-helix protein [Acidobacteriota bacterium]|nr:Helix-turn-helix protein [Acidobacteriota bacterium]